MGKTLAAWIMVAGAVAAPAMGPRETVESAVGRVVTLLQDGDTVKTESTARQAADRRTEIRRLARELFDFEEVTRRTLSRHWAARSADERAEFVALFTDLLERSYVTRVEAYAGENIAYFGEAVDASYATVRSKILTDRRSEIALDYRLHLRDGRWRVYDLQIVDAPPTVTKVEPVIERDLAAAIREDLRPHRGVARVDRFPEVRDVLARVRLDPGDVGALEQVGEERHELGPLIGRACGPVAGERTPRHFLEIEELTREPPGLGTPIPRLPCRRLGFSSNAVLPQRDHPGDRRLPRLSRGHRRGPRHSRHPEP